MAEPSILSESRHKTWVLWHHACEQVQKCEDAAFAKAGISRQMFPILIGIECLDNPVTVADLARWEGRHANSTSMMVDRMEKRGLVEKIRDLPDRRATRLTVTQVGKKMLGESARVGSELIERITSCLSEEELEVFNHVNYKLREKAFEELGESTERIEERKSAFSQDTARLLGMADERQ